MEKVESSPILLDARDDGFQLARFAHVARDDDRTLQEFGERPHQRLGPRVEIRDRKLGVTVTVHLIPG